MKPRVISFVIPVLNEEKNLPILVSKLETLQKKLSVYNFEIIIVDDGSTDNSWSIILDLSKKYKNNIIIRSIRLSRNFGQIHALQAGLEHASGDAVITLDADLQHPPELVSDLIKYWENGYKIVNTYKKTTYEHLSFKVIASRLFYKIINLFTSLNLKYGESDFRLLDKKIYTLINSFPESPKFYRGIVNWIGFESKDIEYQINQRKFGKSGYSIKKMLELARFGLTSFSMLPLKLIISSGFMISFLSGLSFGILSYIKFFINSKFISNNILLTLVILFSTGMMITFQGIVGMYIIDIFNASKKRPPYIISEKINV